MNTRIVVLALIWLLGGADGAFAQTVSFQGEVDFVQQRLGVRVEQAGRQVVDAAAARRSASEVEFRVKVDNLKTPFVLVSTMVAGSLVRHPLAAPGAVVYTSRVQSQYTLLNNKPVADLAGQFQLQDGVLVIHGLSVGDVTARGTVRAIAPYRTDLLIRFQEIPLSDILRFFAQEAAPEAQGEISGALRITGVVPAPTLRLELVSDGGMVGAEGYRSLSIILEGIYPVLRVQSSALIRDDGFAFQVQGGLDLSHYATLDKQIAALQRNPMIASDDQQVEWTLKRLESDDRSGTTELKYLRRKDENINTMSDEYSDMLGVQQKVTF